jgi:hypothetical protein
MNPADNLSLLLQAIPSLDQVIIQLNTAQIRYGIYAGAYVSIVTSNRLAKDVDFLVADEDFPKVKTLFSDSSEKQIDITTFLYPQGNKKIELMTMAWYNFGDSHYSFRLTDLAWKHTSVLECKGIQVRLCNPVETILLKAMLQRGEKENKHDLEDIEDLLKVVTVDQAYLNERLLEVNADERFFKVLEKFHLL